jgi:hypothetical protein
MNFYIENVGQFDESYIVEVIENYFHLGELDTIVCRDLYINNSRIRGSMIVFKKIFHNANTYIMKKEIKNRKPFVLKFDDKMTPWTLYSSIDECKFHSKTNPNQKNQKYRSIHKYIYPPIDTESEFEMGIEI